MDRVFLDANVLFSMAYDPAARISSILKLAETEIVTSDYAAAEALRNIDLKKPAQLDALRGLLTNIKLVSSGRSKALPMGIELPKDDHPILQAAIAGQATHLLTGDSHFRPLFGRVIEGVLVLRPGDYLRMRAEE
jgi:predicted nucleic acid-binding protein